VLGGNRELPVQLEEQITIAGPVRLIAFYDAGQVQSGPVRRDAALRARRRQPRDIVLPDRISTGETQTSTGLEVRFFMPVLNVPFRLIFATIRSVVVCSTIRCCPRRHSVPVRGRIDVLTRERFTTAD